MGFCQAVGKIYQCHCSMSVRMHVGNKLNHGTSWRVADVAHLSGYLYSKGK